MYYIKNTHIMNKIYKLEKPDFSVIKQERVLFLISNMSEIFSKNNLYKYLNEEYLYWDKIKFKKLPLELENHLELWFLIKINRSLKESILLSEENKYFRFWKPDFLNEILHKLDLSLWWNFFNINLNENERKKFLQNWIIEEAISSSQLEGAMTTSKDAKNMIKFEKKPKTKDEIMILNNYKAMKFIKNDIKDEFLTKDILLEIQTILTKWILEEEKIWRFRKNSDKIVVQNNITWEVFHKTPNEEFLLKEIESFLKYANDEEKTKDFTHPFIKACILHFWIWYLHPFCDWNGRTARAIFYWYLLKKWYWGFSYIPLSRIIKETKNKYEKAYLYSEQDDYDLTYFIVYLANATSRALVEFNEYVNKKREAKKENILNLNHLWLNDRQNNLIIYFLHNKNDYTTITIHKNYYWIERRTAEKDLKKLLEKWFLESKKVWKFVRYFPVDNFADLIKKN